MLMPLPPARLFAIAVPGAIAYCTSIGLETGTRFHLRIDGCPAKLRPRENGSLEVFFICRMKSTASAPMARATAFER